MTTQTQAVYDAALALPEGERTQLVERLLESFSQDDNLTDDELATELDRRRVEIESGQVKPIPWSEIQLDG